MLRESQRLVGAVRGQSIGADQQEQLQQLKARLPPTDDELMNMSMEEISKWLTWGLQFVKSCEQAQNEKALCSICLENKKSVVFIPCKHEATCKPCSEKVKQCPICRTTIQDRFVPYR